MYPDIYGSNLYDRIMLEKIAEQELTNPTIDSLEKIAATERLKVKASAGGIKVANAIAKAIKSLSMKPKIAQSIRDIATVALFNAKRR